MTTEHQRAAELAYFHKGVLQTIKQFPWGSIPHTCSKRPRPGTW